MADDPDTKQPKLSDLYADAPPPPPPPPPLPPIPEEYFIPTQLLDQWFKIPEGQYVNINLTRKDFDNLFNALDKNIKAQAIFQSAMTLYTNGHIEAANRAMRDSTIKLTEAHNALRFLYTSIMVSATIK
jgi:hypothetical protein